MGTGDGRAVSGRAAAEPRTLVIGVDADASAMQEASRRAARPPAKGGRANALFVVAAAERPPSELECVADEITITLPWASLLDGVLGRNDAVAAGLASLTAPGGRVRAVVSIAARDGRGLPALEAGQRASIAAAWERHGLALRAFRPATPDEVLALAAMSTWARRLRAGRDRQAWTVVLTRDRPGR